MFHFQLKASLIDINTEIPESQYSIYYLNVIVKRLKRKKILIVLDSAEQHYSNFTTLLATFSKYFSILITSREIYSGITTVDINKLPEKDALAMFKNYYLESEKKLNTIAQHQVKYLLDEIGNLPIAIKILACRAKRKGVETVLAELTDNKEDRLFKISATFLTEEEKKNANAILCFQMSYDDLDEIYKDVFMRCGLFFFPFDSDKVAKAYSENVNKYIEHLVDISLIEYNRETQKYSLHPLLREFALMNAKQTGIINALYEYKKQMYLNADAPNFAEEDIPELFKVIEFCLDNKEYLIVLEFVDKFERDLHIEGHWQRQIQLLDFGLKALEVKPNNDKKAWYLECWGDVLARQNKYEDARQKLIDSLHFKDNLFTHYELLGIEKETHQYAKCVQGSWKYLRKANISNYDEFSIFNRNIGEVFADFHIISSSISLHIPNIKQKRINNRISRSNFIRAFGDFVLLKYKQGEYEKAIHYIYKLLEKAQTENDAETIKDLIGMLLDCYLASEMINEAAGGLSEYKKIISRLGDIDAIANLAQYEGRLFMIKGEFTLAIESFLSMKLENGRNYWLGKAYLAMGNNEEAEKFLNDAFTIYQKQQKAVEMAKCYTEMALLSYQKRLYPDAAKKLSWAINTKKYYGIIDIKREDEVKLVLNEGFSQMGLSFEDYVVKYKEEYISVVPDFMIHDLPSNLTVYTDCEPQGKEMLLIPEGTCFMIHNQNYDIKVINSDYILENIDDFWKGKFLSLPQATEMYLYPFYIDKQPVNNAEYKRFCQTSKHKEPIHWDNNFDIAEEALNPVTNISYQDAESYAMWVEREIPTEAEWEKVFWKENRLFYNIGGEAISIDIKSLMREVSETSIPANSDKKEILRFLVGEEIFEHLMEHPQQLRDWNKINKQNVYRLAHFNRKFADDTMYEPLLSKVDKTIRGQFNWAHLFRLIAYSSTTGGYEKKRNILEKLPSLDETKIQRLFEIYINEAIEFYRLEENNIITAHYTGEQNYWIMAVKAFCGLYADFQISEPTTSEYVVTGKTKRIDHNNRNINRILTQEVEANKAIGEAGFRCVKPIFNNKDFFKFISQHSNTEN